MTPLLPTPDHYLQNLIAMTSSEAKRLWRRSIKEHFDCTCAYCGETYDINELTLDHVHPRSRGGGDNKNLVCACRKCNQEKGRYKINAGYGNKVEVDDLSEDELTDIMKVLQRKQARMRSEEDKE